MSFESSDQTEGPATLFYIGQHETQRNVAVSTDLINTSHDLGYNFLSTPITSTSFQEKVVSLVSSHAHSANHQGAESNILLPSIQPFAADDTCISPDDANAGFIAIVSPWIDLGSSDPIIRHVSRQVFNAEVAYAAFCGITNVLMYAPLPDSDLVQYARAIHEGLSQGSYLNLHVLLPMTGELEQDYGNGTHLSELANGEVEEDAEPSKDPDPIDIWDQWNTIRTVCGYSHKLSIGKSCPNCCYSQTLLLIEMIIVGQVVE